jgi:hypothetical protein
VALAHAQVFAQAATQVRVLGGPSPPRYPVCMPYVDY